MVDRDYIHSIDKRLTKIESDVGDIKANVMGLTVRVSGIASLIAIAASVLIRWIV